MSSYTLRDVPKELWSTVKARAEREGLQLRPLMLSLLEQYAERGLIGYTVEGTAAATADRHVWVVHQEGFERGQLDQFFAVLRLERDDGKLAGGRLWVSSDTLADLAGDWRMLRSALATWLTSGTVREDNQLEARRVPGGQIRKVEVAPRSEARE